MIVFSINSCINEWLTRTCDLCTVLISNGDPKVAAVVGSQWKHCTYKIINAYSNMRYSYHYRQNNYYPFYFTIGMHNLISPNDDLQTVLWICKSVHRFLKTASKYYGLSCYSDAYQSRHCMMLHYWKTWHYMLRWWGEGRHCSGRNR